MTVSLALNLRRAALCTTMAVAAAAGGCSNDGGPGLFATGALGDTKVAAAKPALDPACVALSAQINKLNQDGTVGRLEKAADGKTPDVTVKRASLATQAQLNKANADFIAKCSPNVPKTAMAVPAAPVAAAPAPAPAKVAQAATAKVPAAVTAAKETGVTVVPPMVATDAPAAAPKN